jgi:Uma2 family endonuclease
MAMPATIRRWTAADVHALPDDGQPYEFIHGEPFVTPAPASSHQLVSARILAHLTQYLTSAGRPDTALYSPADIPWGTQTLVQPDIFIRSMASRPTGSWTLTSTWSRSGVPATRQRESSPTRSRGASRSRRRS